MLHPAPVNIHFLARIKASSASANSSPRIDHVSRDITFLEVIPFTLFSTTDFIPPVHPPSCHHIFVLCFTVSLVMICIVYHMTQWLVDRFHFLTLFVFLLLIPRGINLSFRHVYIGQCPLVLAIPLPGTGARLIRSAPKVLPNATINLKLKTG